MAQETFSGMNGGGWYQRTPAEPYGREGADIRSLASPLSGKPYRPERKTLEQRQARMGQGMDDWRAGVKDRRLFR